MNISMTQAAYILEALTLGIDAVNHGTSTHGDPADLHLNRTGYEGRTKMTAAKLLMEKLMEVKSGVA